MSKTTRTLIASFAVLALFTAACGDDNTDDDAAPQPTAETDDGAADEATDDDAAADDGGSETDDGAADDNGDDDGDDDTAAADDDGSETVDDAASMMSGGTDRDFSALPPATGEPIVVGMINTEGPAGLDFPEIRTLGEATVGYLNDHGGFGGRVIELETCVVDGSPEGSQRCAQELAGKGVESVFLGLDLFPDYATYEAEGIGVYGVIPLFPADYASSALYLSGGNSLLNAGIVGTAIEEFGASSVAIVSGDNAGQNSSEASLIAVLEANGVEYVSIKGGNDETDAGYQALVSQALNAEPDVLVSLYGDAGCIGMMRGRAALSTDIPVLAANTCIAADVLDAAGDTADGWYFVGGADEEVTVERAAQQAAAAIELGGSPDDVVISLLGLGNLSQIMFFTTAAAANDLAASGADVTGESIFNHIKTNPNGDLRIFPNGSIIGCGSVPAFVSVCNWEVPVGQYSDGAAPVLGRLDVIPYLPTS